VRALTGLKSLRQIELEAGSGTSYHYLAGEVDVRKATAAPSLWRKTRLLDVSIDCGLAFPQSLDEGIRLSVSFWDHKNNTD